MTPTLVTTIAKCQPGEVPVPGAEACLGWESIRHNKVVTDPYFKNAYEAQLRIHYRGLCMTP
jgi:hypothetical protein